MENIMRISYIDMGVPMVALYDSAQISEEQVREAIREEIYDDRIATMSLLQFQRVFGSLLQQNKKARYRVSVVNAFAERTSTNRVDLTRSQAEAVAYAVNPANWVDPVTEMRFGSFDISLDDPEEIKEENS